MIRPVDRAPVRVDTSTDSEWEKWGARDPYFGVLTNDVFRRRNLDERLRREFFESGSRHVEHVLRTVEARLGARRPRGRALDFGCGVGRVTIPLSRLFDRVVGLDVAPSMLAEARRNCTDAQRENIELRLSDDSLEAAEGDFDLVHSTIVLQHVRIERGRTIFANLVRLVRHGGVGVLHVTYGWDRHAATFGQPSPPPAPPPPSLLERVIPYRRTDPPRSAPAGPEGDPKMEMHYYNFSELMFILQGSGISGFFCEFSDHGGALGGTIYFQRT